MEIGAKLFLTHVCDAVFMSQMNKIENKQEELMKSEEAQFP